MQGDFWVVDGQPISHFPVLIQPLAEKLYDKLGSYQCIWDKLQQVLTDTDSLIVIGCRMDDSENRLWDYLKEYLKPDTAIKIVDLSETGLNEIQKRFVAKGFNNLVPLYDISGFYEYALRSLSNSRI